MLRTNPGENSQSASTASQRFNDRIVRLGCDCGCRRLQLSRYLADLAVELEGHRVRPSHGLTFAYTDISALVRRKDMGLCPATSAGADCCAFDASNRQPSNSYFEGRVREFPELG